MGSRFVKFSMAQMILLSYVSIGYFVVFNGVFKPENFHITPNYSVLFRSFKKESHLPVFQMLY